MMASKPVGEDVTEPDNDVVRLEVAEFTPPKDKPVQARDALTKTIPKAHIVPNKVITTTTRKSTKDNVGRALPRMQMHIYFVCSSLFKRAPNVFWPALMLAMPFSTQSCLGMLSLRQDFDIICFFQIDGDEYSLRQSTYLPSLWFVVRDLVLYVQELFGCQTTMAYQTFQPLANTSI